MRPPRTALPLLAICFLALAAGAARAQSSGGIWTSPAELASLPTSGKAWQSLRDTADEPASTPDVSNQDDVDNVRVLAKALVYARTGEARYRSEVIAACLAAIGSEAGGRTLALGRELIAYVIAADLVGLPAAENQAFRSWLQHLRTATLDGKTLISTHEDRPNNWGTHAGASRLAVALYLGDAGEVARSAQVFKGWLGDRSAHADFSFGDPDWQSDAGRPVAINPKGAAKDGHSLDGALPEEMRRAGGFTWPPPKENYAYEALQGALAQAVILHRLGYDVWNWEDRALLRAFDWLHDAASFPADGDDTWQPHVVNFFYGRNFPAPVPSRPGKNVGFTDWLYPAGASPAPVPSPGALDCSRDADCDDGLYCNGVERCSGGACQSGSPIDCNDGVACTLDFCDETSRGCTSQPDPARCDDGLFCTGAETCDAQRGCLAGPALSCDDGIACTSDRCNESRERCDHVPDDGLCQNGLFCDGAETCDRALGCRAATLPACDDGLACTSDTCDPSSGCLYASLCPSGETCSGASGVCEAELACAADAECDDGNPCTRDTCAAGECASSAEPGACTPSIVYAEDFELGFGSYRNAAGDDMDWTHASGATPSTKTGPSADHTRGDDLGHYLYTEASTPGHPDKRALLEGPCIDLGGASAAELEFWYHMQGDDMGTLAVDAAAGCSGDAWTPLFSLSGEQGDAWLQARLDLRAWTGGWLRLRFSAVTGLDYHSDMALDDVALRASWDSPCSEDADCDDGLVCTLDVCTGGVCLSVAECPNGGTCDAEANVCSSPECTSDADCGDSNACTLDHCEAGTCQNRNDPALCLDSFPFEEHFETGLGAWRNGGGDDIDWTRNRGATPSRGTGPTGDQTSGDGWYLYTEASVFSTNPPGSPSKTALLESPCLDLGAASEAEWSFWYHMAGLSMGELSAEVAPDCGAEWVRELRIAGEQGSQYRQSVVDLRAYAGGRVRLRLRGLTGSGYQSDMAIDDLAVSVSP